MATLLKFENKAACLLLCIFCTFLHQLDPTNAQRRPQRRQGEEKPTEPIPVTSFSCQGRVPGYYADPESGCQLYHMCQAGGRQFTYRCPEHTLFQQRMMVCDHWFMVDCQASPTHYDANLLIGDKSKLFIEAGETIRREFVQDPDRAQRRSFTPPSPTQSTNNLNKSTNKTSTTPLFDQFSFPSTIINSITTPRPATPSSFTKTTVKFQPSKFSTVKIVTNIPKSTQTPPTTQQAKGRNSRIPITNNKPINFTQDPILNFQNQNLPNTQKPNNIINLPISNTPINTPLNVPISQSRQQSFNPTGFNIPIKTTQEPIFNTNTQKPINKPIGLTETTLSLIKNTFNLTKHTDVTRPIFQTTTYRPITTSNENNDIIYPATINSLMLNNDNVPVLLKFIPDTRRMFYIPNSFEDIPSDFQQQNLEFESLRNTKAMRFVNDFNDEDSILINGCNSKCFPAFFKPGTCEPCVILR